MKKLILLGLLLGLTSTLFSQQNWEFTVHFDVNEYKLDDSAQKVLSQHTTAAKPSNSYQVKVVGHTDSDGSNSFNEELSLKRANAVKNYLTSNGFDVQKIDISAEGESKPKSDKKAENRRVEVFVTFSTTSTNENISNNTNDGVNDNSTPSTTATSNATAEALRLNTIEVDESVFNLDNTRPQQLIKSVNAQEGGTIKYSSGSVITIPANTLVYANGDPVQGDVDIKYIEYRDQVDIMFSGLPMTYDSAGTQYIMESGGMFEISASQNDQEVEVAPGKEIRVDFEKTDANNYNFYQINNDGHWDDTHGSMAASNANDTVTSNEVRSVTVNFNGWQSGWTNKNYYPYFDEKYVAIETGDRYFNTGPIDQTVPTFEWRFENFGYAGTELVPDIANKKDDRSIYHIFLDQESNYDPVKKFEFTVKDLSGANTELEPYIDQIFKIDDINFVDAFYKYDYAIDLRITYNEASNDYELKLKYASGIKTLKAKLLYPSHVGVFAQKTSNQAKHKKYLALLEERKQRFEVTRRLHFARRRLGRTYEFITFWKYSKPFMTDAELRMTSDEWLDYFRNNESAMKLRYTELRQKFQIEIAQMHRHVSAYEDITKSYDEGRDGEIQYTKIERPNFSSIEPGTLVVNLNDVAEIEAAEAKLNSIADTTTNDHIRAYMEQQKLSLYRAQGGRSLLEPINIPGFGTFNCDVIKRLHNPIEIIAIYVDEDGNKIDAVHLSMLVLGTNSVLTQNPIQFTYASRMPSHFVVIDSKSNYYVIREPEIRKQNIQSTGTYTFTMKRVEVEKPDDLRKILKM